MRLRDERESRHQNSRLTLSRALVPPRALRRRQILAARRRQGSCPGDRCAAHLSPAPLCPNPWRVASGSSRHPDVLPPLSRRWQPRRESRRYDRFSLRTLLLHRSHGPETISRSDPARTRLPRNGLHLLDPRPAHPREPQRPESPRGISRGRGASGGQLSHSRVGFFPGSGLVDHRALLDLATRRRLFRRSRVQLPWLVSGRLHFLPTLRALSPASLRHPQCSAPSPLAPHSSLLHRLRRRQPPAPLGHSARGTRRSFGFLGRTVEHSRHPRRLRLGLHFHHGRFRAVRLAPSCRPKPGSAVAMTSSSDVVASNASTSRLSPELSRLAILLALSIFINYIDRGNLAIAAPLIKDDLGLSYSQLGVLLSSFFYTYALFQIVSGWLVDRFPVNWVLALGILVWSAATFGTGLVSGFKLLFVIRLILGIGESVAYPSYSKIISRHFSESQRGRANSLISAGQASGPAVGTLLGGMLIAHAGWRIFFMVFGVASSLWLLPWLKFLRSPAPVGSTGILPASDSAMPGTTGIPPASELVSATILQILQQRSAWGTFAGLFSYNYLWYFFITWLPFYLVRERLFSVRRMSIVTGPGPVIASSILLVGIVANHSLAVALLMLACIGLGMCTSNLWSVTQTLAGPATSGKWTGLQNFTGNLAGWIAPALIGLIVQRTGNFFWVFVITSGVTLLGAAAWIFVVGPIQPVAWSTSK